MRVEAPSPPSPPSPRVQRVRAKREKIFARRAEPREGRILFESGGARGGDFSRGDLRRGERRGVGGVVAIGLFFALATRRREKSHGGGGVGDGGGNERGVRVLPSAFEETFRLAESFLLASGTSVERGGGTSR